MPHNFRAFRPSLPLRVAVLPCTLTFALAACDTSVPQDAPPPEKPAVEVKGTDRLRPEYDEAGKLQKLQYDRNGDGKVDTWGYMDGARVVRVEVDESGDGKVDRWEYHRADTAPAGQAGAAGAGAALAGPDKTVERIERATRFDGTVTRREFFENGVLTRIEEDTDANGKVDKWETYVGGALSLMALDTSGRGTPDRRLVYGPDGSLSRIEEDPNGSGQFRPIPQ